MRVFQTSDAPVVLYECSCIRTTESSAKLQNILVAPCCTKWNTRREVRDALRGRSQFARRWGDEQIIGTTTSGLSVSVARAERSTRTSSSFNSVPPWPTNRRMMRVRGGGGILRDRRCRTSAMVASRGMARPGCSSTPLPNASTGTYISCGCASEVVSARADASPSALIVGAEPSSRLAAGCKCSFCATSLQFLRAKRLTRKEEIRSN